MNWYRKAAEQGDAKAQNNQACSGAGEILTSIPGRQTPTLDTPNTSDQPGSPWRARSRGSSWHGFAGRTFATPTGCPLVLLKCEWFSSVTDPFFFRSQVSPTPFLFWGKLTPTLFFCKRKPPEPSRLRGLSWRLLGREPFTLSTNGSRSHVSPTPFSFSLT